MPISSTYRPAITALTGYRVEVDSWAAGMPGQDIETVKGVVDEQGTTWYLTKLEGWDDAPPPRNSLVSRVGEHGSFDGPAFLDVRAVTIEGVAVCLDRVSTWRARDILASICGDPSLGLSTLKITKAGYDTRQALVRRSGATKTQLLTPGVFRWSLIFVSPDPRRYSAALHTLSAGLPTSGSGGLVFPVVFPLTFGVGSIGGQISVINAGTIDVWPTLKVTGPVTGPLIRNLTTGEQLFFDDSLVLSSGQTLVIDTDVKTALLGAASRRSDLLLAQWFTLPPGTTLLGFSHQGGFDAAAQLTCEWRDGWT